MNRWGALLAILIGIWVAGSLQQVLAPRLAIAGAMPDFLIVLLAASSLFMPRASSAAVGFACGLVQGALAGANLMHYVISRSIAAFLTSWPQNQRLEPNAMLAFGTAFFLTLVSQILFMFLAPPRQLMPYLGATIVSAAYNGVLVLPVYFPLRRLVKPRA